MRFFIYNRKKTHKLSITHAKHGFVAICFQSSNSLTHICIHKQYDVNKLILCVCNMIIFFETCNMIY